MIVFYLAYLLMASAISVIYSTGILQNKLFRLLQPRHYQYPDKIRI